MEDVTPTPLSNGPEGFRTYHYADGSTFTVYGVSALLVRPSGTHRLETVKGEKIIVLPGFIAITIEASAWSR